MLQPMILVVEDDLSVRKLITTTLETKRYQYREAERGATALKAFEEVRPNVIILDLGLPDIDGTEIIRRIRRYSDCPIVVLSCRHEDKDKIQALDLGADDYLTKPFSVDELLARLRVSLRRVQQKEARMHENADIFVNGDLMVIYSKACVSIAQEEIKLTPIEYKLLMLLCQNAGKVLTHNYLLREIWGYYTNYSADISALRVFMATLRKKLKRNPDDPEYIQTHVGIGYRMLEGNAVQAEAISHQA